MFQFPDTFEWLFPWQPLADDYAVMDFDDPASAKPTDVLSHQLLAKELHREMVQGHKLFEETVVPIAVYTLTHKDFLFATANPEKPIACVHLTWSRETDPTWPMTQIYRSLEDWVVQMKFEHKKTKHLHPE